MVPPSNKQLKVSPSMDESGRFDKHLNKSSSKQGSFYFKSNNARKFGDNGVLILTNEETLLEAELIERKKKTTRNAKGR